MNIQFLRQEALDCLAKDVSANIASYAAGETPWADEFFVQKEVKTPYFDSGIITEDIKLIPGNDASLDIENAIILYNALKGKLLPAQATDRRLWVYLSHYDFYPYMCSRWPVENQLNDKGTNGTVTDRYFTSRGFFRNGISRLYWIAELTYDESLDDPYEYTRYLFSYQDLINQVEGYSFSRNRTILQSFLKVMKNNPALTEAQKRLYFENICKYGGTTVLDALPVEPLEDLCSKSYTKASGMKQITQGSVVALESIESGRTMTITVNNGKPYVGNQLFRSNPKNLYRLTVGKVVTIGKVQYIITAID